MSLALDSQVKLVILDLNGVLIRRYGRGTSTTYEKRPYLDSFLDVLFANYDVAVYTSTEERNASLILEEIFTEQQRRMLKFVWYRDRTQLDPDYGVVKGVKSFDTIKDLALVILSPTINSNRIYSENNILIIDDSKSKLRFNLPDNCLVIPPFSRANDNILMNLHTKIEYKFKRMGVIQN